MQRLTRTFFQASCLIACFPAHAEPIDEVVVTAVRRAVAEDQLSVALGTVGREDVSAEMLVTDALANAAGVFLQQTTPGQGAAIVRGQKGSAVLHLVDGMRLNNAIFRSAPTQYFALVPTSAVERAEVLRGTPASLYGSDAIGGVVQIVTRKPEFETAGNQVRGELSVRANTAEEARVIGGTFDAGNRHLATSFGAEYADVGDRRIGGGDTVRPSGFTARSARLIVAARPDDSTSWSIDLQHAEQPRTPRTDELVPGFGETEPASSEFFFRPNRRTFVHLDGQSLEGALGLDWNVDFAWQRIDDDRQTRDLNAPERTLEENRSDLFGLTISVSQVTETVSWITGLDLYYDDVSSRRVREDIVTGVQTAATPRFPDGSSMELLSAYGNGTWSAGERHAVTFGLRLSDVRTRLPSTSVHNTEISGDVGWVATINDGWQFTANLGYGFRAPNVFDLGTLGNRPGNRFNIPNTDLESEHVVHGDLGIRYRNSVADFAVSVYLLDYTDRITSVATGNVTPEGREITQSVNAASSEIHGVEATARVDIGSEWFVSANLTYTRGDQRIAGSAEEPADRVPPLSGVVEVEFAPESVFGFEAWASFAGSQDRLSARDVRDSRIDPNGTPGWASIGASAHWRPTDAWRVSLELANVFDAGYRVHGSGIDATGRNATLSARWSW
ncbi:MAG: TonB-dependent receptor [Woeseiaceae bacterium]|nr:TonB-dependent receptor [Woeseiaceae bacterium]